MGRGRSGFTLVELIIVVAIVGLLAGAALPLARWGLKRGSEHELQQDLRILRNAIDRYHDAAVAGLIEIPEGANGYPASLDVLVEGVPLIAPMPIPGVGVSGAYDASGQGLTGGLPAQVQAQQGTGQALGASTSGGISGQGAGTGAARPGGRSLFSSTGGQSQSVGGRSFGATGTSGFAGARGASAPQGSGFAGAGTAGRAPGGFGPQGSAATGFRPAGSERSTVGGFDQQGSGRGGFGSQGGASGEPPQPIVGPDGQPVKLVLLRRLPRDPFTGKADWGLRCYGEPPEDRMWCGRDVFDVYSKSFAKAIDGSSYRDW